MIKANIHNLSSFANAPLAPLHGRRWVRLKPMEFHQAIKPLLPREIQLLAQLLALMEWDNQIQIRINQLLLITGWTRSSVQHRLQKLRRHKIIAGISGDFMVNPAIAYFGNMKNFQNVSVQFRLLCLKGSRPVSRQAV